LKAGKSPTALTSILFRSSSILSRTSESLKRPVSMTPAAHTVVIKVVVNFTAGLPA
jgi:hypothetical protein